MIRQFFVATMIACSSLSAMPALAGTLVDTGSPVGGNFVLGLDDGEFGSRLAARFTLASNANISGAEINLTVLNDGILNYDIVSAANGLPDTSPVLFSSAVSLAFQIDGWSGPTGLDWNLAAGDYWLVVRPEDGGGLLSQLSMFTPNPLASYAYYYNDERIWRASAPDPRFGGDFGVRIFGTAGAVPEPESWGLMLTGFALTGAALRRRRLQTA